METMTLKTATLLPDDWNILTQLLADYAQARTYTPGKPASGPLFPKFVLVGDDYISLEVHTFDAVELRMRLRALGLGHIL